MCVTCVMSVICVLSCLTWQSAQLQGPGEVEEGVAGVEDVGALRVAPHNRPVGAPPVLAQLGAVLQRQVVVAVVQHQHRRPDKIIIIIIIILIIILLLIIIIIFILITILLIILNIILIIILIIMTTAVLTNILSYSVT